MSSWVHKNTARKVRALAGKAGHDLSRLDAGGDTAIASCRNPGCTVMVERFIRLGDETCARSRPWIIAGYHEEGSDDSTATPANPR